MPRLSQLDQVLFPVAEHPVFALVKDQSGERHLRVPGKKAIVNVSSQRVLGVVSRGYRLVSNREALEWAYECCVTVFPETNAGEWGVKAIDAPSSGGYCRIDLFHNSTVLDFSFVPPDQRSEAFGPFIRVTNSYNGLRALAFDIGFYRKVCTNGLIVPQSIIHFTFNHLRREIGETIAFEIAHERLEEVRNSLRKSFDALRTCEVARSDFEPLVCSVLALKQPKPWEPTSRKAQDWEALNSHLTRMSDRYAQDLGENAYAVFNTITEFASHPPDNLCVHRDRHSFQRLAGTWVDSFTEECRRPDFSLAEYLEKAVESKTNGSPDRALTN